MYSDTRIDLRKIRRTEIAAGDSVRFIGQYVLYTEHVIRKQHTTEGVIKMERFELRYVMGHIEVYDENGRFCFSADHVSEAMENCGRSSAQPDPYRLIGEKSLPPNGRQAFAEHFLICRYFNQHL